MQTGSSSGPAKKLCLPKRRRALLTSLAKKPFIPLCTPKGYYQPLQCQAFQGYCWCVDDAGMEIKGSRTKRTPDCFSKTMEIRPCHAHKKHIKQLPYSDKIHPPACRPDGFYKPMQCSKNKDYCWCVTYNGKELRGTVTFGIPQCPDTFVNLTDALTANHPSRRSPCIRHKEKRMKLFPFLRRSVFDPKCDKDGYYAPKQCHRQYCWCSSRKGIIVKGSRKKGDVQCPGRVLPPCRAARLKAGMILLFKKPFIPQCTSDGYFAPVQCDSDAGVCWCANKHGKEITGSKTKRTPNCFGNVIGEGPCSLLKSHIDNLPPTSIVHEPLCDRDGFFQQTQCSKTKEYCWCVMSDGTEIEGSVTFGKPSCLFGEKRAPAEPKVRGPCEEYHFQVNNLGRDREVAIPVCDDKGFFAPRQCNNDTSWCWCVNRYGSIIRGTHMKGFPICDPEAVRPCHVFKKNPRPLKLDEAYDPVCTKKGYFAPLQCNVNNGKCWCVDKMGVKVPGTSIYQRPYCGTERRLCEIQRRTVVSKNGNELLPSCDIHGYYIPVQCDHLKSECWCSDRNGNEISETRIKGIPKCGQLPKPCDEHASRTSNYDYVFGVYTPQCDSKGYYKNVQCHDKTDMCWCSNKLGVEIPGTKMKGKPRCFK